MEAKVYDVPAAMDDKVARYALASMDIGIDSLTPDQRRYLTTLG
jgi:S-adenosylhomocysteine hydrolase